MQTQQVPEAAKMVPAIHNVFYYYLASLYKVKNRVGVCIFALVYGRHPPRRSV